MATLRTLETETAIFSIENNIMFVQYKKGADVHLKNVKTNLEVRKKIQQGGKMLVFVDVSEVWQFSTEARKFVGKSRLENLTIAMAILTGYSMPIKIIANFFMKLNKPSYPTKLFNDRNQALKWLDSFSIDKIPLKP